MELLLDKTNTLLLFAGIFSFAVFIKILLNVYYMMMVRASYDMNNVRMKSLDRIKKRYIEGYDNSPVKDIDSFVEKHMYDIRVFGLSCGAWDFLDTFIIVCCLIAGVALGYLAYIRGYGYRGSIDYVLYGLFAGVSVIMINVLINIRKKAEHIKINICDYFANEYVRPIQPSESDMTDCAGDTPGSIKSISDEIDKKISGLPGMKGKNKEDELLNEIIKEYLT